MPKKRDQYSTAAMKIIKLMFVLTLSEREYSLTELTKELTSSKSRVLGYIDQLRRSYGIQIELRKKGRENMYKIKKPKILPHTQILSRDISRLLLCLNMVEPLLPDSFKEQAHLALKKSTILISDLDNKAHAFETLAGSMLKGGIDYNRFEEIMLTLMRAIREKAVCEVHYQGLNKNEPSMFYFAPHRFMAYREALYVMGWSVDESVPAPKFRQHLPLHRFKSVELTRVSHDFKDKPGEDFFGFPECNPFEGVIRFSPDAGRYVTERTWSSEQSLKKLKDDRVELTLTAQSESELISWVLSFGANAELIKPETLREKITSQLAAMQSSYQC